MWTRRGTRPIGHELGDGVVRFSDDGDVAAIAPGVVIRAAAVRESQRPVVPAGRPAEPGPVWPRGVLESAGDVRAGWPEP